MFSGHTLHFFFSSTPPGFVVLRGGEGESVQRPCLLPEWLISQVHAWSSLLRGGPCSKPCQGAPCVTMTVRLVDLISIQLALTLGCRAQQLKLPSSGSGPATLNLSNGFPGCISRANHGLCCRVPFVTSCGVPFERSVAG